MAPKKKTEQSAEESQEPSMSPFRVQLQASILETEEGEEIATQIMQEVTDKACDLMVSNYLDRTAIPYTVQVLYHETFRGWSEGATGALLASAHSTLIVICIVYVVRYTYVKHVDMSVAIGAKNRNQASTEHMMDINLRGMCPMLHCHRFLTSVLVLCCALQIWLMFHISCVARVCARGI